MAVLEPAINFTAQLTVAWETFALADALGMDPAVVARVLAHGSGGSRAAGILAASGFDKAGLRQAAPLLRKDVGIMLDVARTAGATDPAALVRLVDAALSALEQSDTHGAGRLACGAVGVL